MLPGSHDDDPSSAPSGQDHPSGVPTTIAEWAKIRDTEAWLAEQGEGTRRQRRNITSAQHANRQAMAKEDMRAQFANLRDQVFNLAQGPPEPPPKFLGGQSVLQWWAQWFATAKEPPQTYSKNNRPQWYMAEVLCSIAGKQSIKYAGVQVVAQCYHVY